MSVSLHLTDAAAAKVLELIQAEGKPFKLRAYVEGGGCSGFKYGFKFDEHIQEGDIVVDKLIEAGLVQLLVDSFSYSYLENAKIDYKEDIEGAQFVIHNPNATTTCGCGSSFSMD